MNLYTNIPLVITEQLNDDTGKPITNATVSATLYYQRDRLFPQVTPGTAITGFTNVSMTNTSTQGQYSATVPAISVLLMPPCGDYVLVIDGFNGVNQVYHKEEPSVVQIGVQQ